MSRSVKYKDLPDKYKPDKVLMPDGTLAYPSDDTLIRVDEEGKPLDYSELAKENYAEVNEDGSYTAVKQLPEIIVTFTPKKRFIEKVNDAVTGFVNDNILMNKDNIRGKNMEKVYKTISGKQTIDNIKEGQNIAAGMIASTMAPLAVKAAVPYIPEVVGSYIGGKAADLGVKATTDYNTWGEAVSNKTGLPIWLAEMTNPGSWYGGAKFNFVKNKDLLSKTIKGDKELGWSKLDKNHWILNGGATPSNIALASINRVMPFLYSAEKTPLRWAAYQIGKRSKGNANLSLKDVFTNPSSYTGSIVEGEGKNLLGMYLFGNDPIIKHTNWFKNIAKQFKPVSKRFFRKGEKPLEGMAYYKMDTAIPEGNHIIFPNKEDLLSYNIVGKPSTKQLGFTVKTGNGKYSVMPMSGSNPIGPLDDVGNHGTLFYYDRKGQLNQKSWDIWDFDVNLPENYKASNLRSAISTSKQAALMRNAGTHIFTLGAHHPVMIGNKKVYSSLDKIPAYRLDPNSRIGATVLQQGGIIELLYTPSVKQDEPSTLELPDISIDIPFMDLDNPFSDIDVSDYSTEYNDIEENDYSFDEIITDQTFDSAYDAVEAQYPIASKYRTLLTLIAEQESGFNPHAKNPNAPAYGYFQFMQGDRWNNISEYAGVDINTFLNNPEIQIKAAVDLAEAFENSFTEEDIKKAKSLGYGMDSMIAGAWLAGPGGVKKFIWEGINRDDKHWSPEGAGVSVKQIMDKYA